MFDVSLYMFQYLSNTYYYVLSVVVYTYTSCRTLQAVAAAESMSVLCGHPLTTCFCLGWSAPIFCLSNHFFSANMDMQLISIDIKYSDLSLINVCNNCNLEEKKTAASKTKLSTHVGIADINLDYTVWSLGTLSCIYIRLMIVTIYYFFHISAKITNGTFGTVFIVLSLWIASVTWMSMMLRRINFFLLNIKFKSFSHRDNCFSMKGFGYRKIHR